uniref:Secreted protein n=1 Tax=Oryza nivara TaxID=4536 RepID=A0A0E0IL60_ORYNI
MRCSSLVWSSALSFLSRAFSQWTSLQPLIAWLSSSRRRRLASRRWTTCPLSSLSCRCLRMRDRRADSRSGHQRR